MNRSKGSIPSGTTGLGLTGSLLFEEPRTRCVRRLLAGYSPSSRDQGAFFGAHSRRGGESPGLVHLTRMATKRTFALGLEPLLSGESSACMCGPSTTRPMRAARTGFHVAVTTVDWDDGGVLAHERLTCQLLLTCE